MKDSLVNQASALRSMELVALARSALAASLFGSFAALLVVGYQIARTRTRPRPQ